MKKIEAIIRHHMLDAVKRALGQAVVTGMTITEIRGSGRQKGHSEVYRGAEYTVDLLPKIKVEIAVRDEMASEVVETILRHTRTGEVGDGKIFVSPLQEVIRIRTGELGEAAL